jgi:chromosome segregation ATPase
MQRDAGVVDGSCVDPIPERDTMTMVDLTLRLLKQIRDGVQTTNARLDQTRAELGARIDQTNAHLTQTNAHLTQTNASLDQTRTELGARIDQTRTELIERIDQTRAELGERLGETNARLQKMDVRLTSVEGHIGDAVGLLRILADKDERLAIDVADLRRRVEALEASPSQ